MNYEKLGVFIALVSLALGGVGLYVHFETRLTAAEDGGLLAVSALRDSALDDIRELRNQTFDEVRLLEEGLSSEIAAGLAASPKLFVSNIFRLQPGSTSTHQHTLGSSPAIVQVWSSTSETGPWDLVTGNVEEGHTYGVWVTDVNSETISLQKGNYTATATYGQRTHYDRYGSRGQNAFFRITAISGS